MLKTADQISVTQTAIIKEIIDSPLKLNLMELGFLPGKVITLKHSAPMGGPMAFQLDETILALRKTEASLIEVQLP
jgi:ferrous iron transport protein A